MLSSWDLGKGRELFLMLSTHLFNFATALDPLRIRLSTTADILVVLYTPCVMSKRY
jgi:hypothetical protein